MPDLKNLGMVITLILLTSALMINYVNDQASGKLLNLSSKLIMTDANVEKSLNITKDVNSDLSTYLQANPNYLLNFGFSSLVTLVNLIYQGFFGWSIILGAAFTMMGLGTAGSSLGAIIGTILGMIQIITVFLFLNDFLIAIRGRF